MGMRAVRRLGVWFDGEQCGSPAVTSNAIYRIGFGLSCKNAVGRI